MLQQRRRDIGIAALSLLAVVLCTAPMSLQAATASPPSQKTLVLGAAVSKSGALAKEGGNLRDGYELWKDKVNAAGGIKIEGVPYKVEINYLDDRSEANTSVKLVEKFITEDKLMIILGPFGSGITNATSEGINSKIQTLKLMACGYRNREHYKTAILFHCGGLDLYPRAPEAGTAL